MFFDDLIRDDRPLHLICGVCEGFAELTSPGMVGSAKPSHTLQN